MTIGSAARLVNMILGLWLFVSVFAWPHTAAQMVNVALVGIFVALTALSAWSSGPRPRLRFVNVALGLWLIVSIFAFPAQSSTTTINSAAVGALVLLFALVPDRPMRRRTA